MFDRSGGDAARELLQFAADRGADYVARLREGPVDATLAQTEIRRRLGESLSDEGEDPAAVLEALAGAEGYGVVKQSGPRFFAYVIGGTYPVGVAADWLSSAWDHPPGTPLAAPLGCAIEEILERWILDLLDLPRESSVGLTTGATMGNFVGIAAARHALLAREGWDVEARGLFGAPEIAVLISEEAHPTVLHALRMTGLGAERVVRIPCDGEARMRPEALEEALRAVRGPTLVCAQAGNINTGAIDPLSEIARLTQSKSIWLHVDGAFGLWARAGGRKRRSLAVGAELADSWAIDAHKWLNTPYDCGFAIVRDRKMHMAAMSIRASYLSQVEGARDPSHYVPELSRRGRGLPVYAVMRMLGRKGLHDLVERCCENASLMRDRLTKEPGISCLNAVTLNQALFRFSPRDGDETAADALTKDVADRVRRGGVCWVQTAQHRGRTVMRFSVVSHMTTEADIEESADAIISAWRAATA